MTGSRRYGWRSLRFKLVLASVVVEALMLTVLVWNSTRITGNALQEIFQDRIETLTPLLNVSLANPLVQRDYATLGERLKIIVNRDSLVYVEVRDEQGQLAASHGTVPETAQSDTSFEVPDHIYDKTFDIMLAGRVIGHARYGLNVSLFQVTLASLRNQGVLVAAVEIVLTILLLATLGALLTRHLSMLAQAARTLQGGDYSARVRVVGHDEVADTARAFNAMAGTLVRDLTEREQAKHKIAEYANHMEQLSRRLLTAQEDERRRLARELHDELGQALTAIKINLQARERLKDRAHDLDAENLRIVEDTLQQVRQLALALRPSMLDDLGLEPALRWMAEQQAEHGGFTMQLNMASTGIRLAPEIETACFRIAQEALTNIARHARAKRVTIELQHEGDALILTVQDDGCGFDVSAARARAVRGGSIGVLGIQERAVLAGGQIEIESSPTRGTTVRVRLPWRARVEAA